MRIKKTEQRWFDVPNDPDKARVKVKHLSPQEFNSIVDEAFTEDITYQKDEKGKMQQSITQDKNKEKLRELPITLSVMEWENFYDSDDKLMECTEENKIVACREMEGFIEFVTECKEKLAEDINAEKKAQIKNLQSSTSK